MDGVVQTSQEMGKAEDRRDHVFPLELFKRAKDEGRPLFVSAPMVRYSKLAFRQTVVEYGVDLAYTPMILAKEFNRSHYARDSDFTLPPNEFEVPTIVQLGSSSPTEFARTTSMLLPYCSGVDLNCGCPQSWACAESIGAALMEKPELVCDIIRAAKQTIKDDGYGGRRTMSVKIRIHKDLEQTRRFIEAVQEAGVDYITIHGRLKSTRSTIPVNFDAVAYLRQYVKVPLLFNGDVESLSKAQDVFKKTGVDGVMSARDILHNPALFTEAESCTWEAVEKFMNFVVKAPLPLKLVVHHLNVMTEGGKSGSPGLLQGDHGLRAKVTPLLTKAERLRLINCMDMLDVIDLLDEIRGVRRL